jgi:modulator of FtsH protease
MESALEGWSEFNVAMAGATAALAGLIIVAMSVNIAEIMKAPTLPARSAASIGTLVLAIVASLVCLIPGQPLWAIGVEVLAGTAIAVVFEVAAIRRIVADEQAPPGSAPAKIAVGVLPLAAFAVGSVALMTGQGWGIGLLAAGCILAIVGSVIIAWVVLVEILR